MASNANAQSPNPPNPSPEALSSTAPGNPSPDTSTSGAVSVSTSGGSPSRPTSSATTGSGKAASAPASATGTQLSVSGFGAPPANLTEARAVLADAAPGRIDEALPAWLPPSIASRIEAVWRSRQPAGALPGDPWDESYIDDYRLAEGAGAADAKAALATVERLLAPAGARDCAHALGLLKVKTKERNLTQEDLALQVRVYAEELTAYPIDAVRAACRDWADTETFFPAWNELRRLCMQEVLYRRSLACALRATIALCERRERDAKALAKPETPANALWREMTPTIKDHLGERVWDVWLSQVTPHLDDGETLVLAAHSNFWASQVKERFGEALEEILGRRVVVRMYPWAGATAEEREKKGPGA